MMVAIASRYQTALTLMQAAATWQAQDARQTRSGPLLPGQAADVAPARPRDMKAINDYYFGSHLTPTKLMFHLFERLAGYLNDRLALGRDGDEAAAAEGREWRGRMLRDDVAIGSERDFSLPRPGEAGFSFRRVAQMIASSFDLGQLSLDRDLVKLIEDTMGFRMSGISVADLIESFLDATGKTQEKVTDALEKGLAWQAGSKVMQRLEAAAEGPKSVEETLEAQKPEPMDIVDEETIEEDREAIRDAVVREKLEAVRDRQDRLAQLDEEARNADGADGTQLATQIIQALAAAGEPEAGTPEREDETAIAEADPGPASTGTAPDEQEEDARRGAAVGDTASSDLLDAIIRAYRETAGEDEKQRDDDERPLPMLI